MSKFLKVIDDIFTEEECKSIIKLAENRGLDDIDRGIAKYHRTIIKDKKLSDKLYIQLKSHIPIMFNGSKTICLNDHFRFSKYFPGEEFGLHKDGINQDSFGNRSVMTLNIFLNDDFSGGETDFYFDDQKKLRYSVIPKIGRGALFDSQQYHCGNKVLSGYKYLLRTDVMVDI
ncbi:Hypothetical protein KVN_LOCUS118 [uncultured virus]|nr:Hypothetical protein KVN_LOCUS118 [uncultured virus]